MVFYAFSASIFPENLLRSHGSRYGLRYFTHGVEKTAKSEANGEFGQWQTQRIGREARAAIDEYGFDKVCG